MPVPTLITDLSTTPASNSPSGSENVFPNLDDYLRFTSAALASIRDNSGNGWVSPYLSTSWPASPTAIGSSTPAAGAFTTLSASSTVSGAGFSAYLASPPAIGGTTPAAGAFTTVAGTTGTFSSGVLLSGAVLAGYTTGSGGTVTQATNKFTTVVLNKPTGRITTASDLLAAGATANFILSNSLLSATDVLMVNVVGGVTDVRNYDVAAGFNATGSVQIIIRNVSTGSLSEALLIQFVAIKGATS